MTRLIPFLILFLATTVGAKTLKIAVVDTGLNVGDSRFAGLICPIGSKDFTGTGLVDTNGHGTHIAGLIKNYAGNGNYCFLIYKYYQDGVSASINLQRELEAFKEAINDDADIVNFSGGGQGFNEDEALLIKYHPEILFVVAAGNEGKNLDIPGNEYYPASLFYGNMEVIYAVDVKGNRLPFSNYGVKTETGELGDNVYSYLPNSQMGFMTGSSQATAIHTGKVIRKMLDATK